MMALAALLLASQLNPAVTPKTVNQTICVPGWASAYRAAHPVKGPAAPGMVRDHNVSIELGGSSDASNIRLQTVASSRAKDALENDLNDLVCAGLIPLGTAQRAIVKFKDVP